MPRQATVYQVFIASPSDVIDERNAIKDVILEWNASHSIRTGILLEPVLWESHSRPQMGERTQEIINRQLVKDGDFLIAVFWSKIGTKTGKSLSGTVEEIEQFMSTNRSALIYFSNCPIHPDKIDSKQIALLDKFKKNCRSCGLYSTYNNLDEFKSKLAHHLSREINVILDNQMPSNYIVKIKQTASYYNPLTDIDREKIQADVLFDLDNKAITKSISYIRKNNDSNNIKILDVGCGFGYVTNNRFGKQEDIEILGIDKNEGAIKLATEQYGNHHIKFSVGDIEEKNYFPGKYDLIFCGFVLHHLGNSEGVLNKLWSMLNPFGVLIIRTFDENMKLNYPHDEDLEFLISTTNNIRGSSDRSHGRNLYMSLTKLEPKPIKTEMIFETYSTVGMTSKQRLDYFNWVFSFRANPAIVVAEEPNATLADKALADKLGKIINEKRKKFTEDSSFFSSTCCMVGLTYKGQAI